MRQPCAKHCPGRTPGCKTGCPKWAEYQESLRTAREARERERILDGYEVKALNDNRKRYGWRGRRPKL